MTFMFKNAIKLRSPYSILFSSYGVVFLIWSDFLSVNKLGCYGYEMHFDQMKYSLYPKCTQHKYFLCLKAIFLNAIT